jgi:hypothetical protein
MTIQTNEKTVTFKFRNRECKECGCRFDTNVADAKNCSVSCRKAWNNRKAVRGDEMYDFLMLRRFGDDAVKGKNSRAYANECLAIVDSLLSGYREADKERRAGRRSYNDLGDAKARLNRLPSCPDYNR